MKISIDRSKDDQQKIISPYIFGNFVECGFGRQTAGMWSEKIYNRSFQPIPPYKDITWHWLGLDREQYGNEAPFWHSGYEENNWEILVPGEKASEYTEGTESHKGYTSFLVNNHSDGQPQGLIQRGIYFREGEVCRFQIFAGYLAEYALKLIPPLDGITSSVHVNYENKPLKAEFIDEKTGKVIWSETCLLKPVQSLFTMTVDPGGFCGHATLRLTFSFAGTFIVSWCSLMPEDNISGWRKDVADLIKELRIPVIRFPGGCYTSFFDWRSWTVPRVERKTLPSLFWGGLDENDTGIDEFLDLCSYTGSQPQICINMMTSNPFEAGQLVEYCNGSDLTEMGRLRKLNGIERKMKVRFWEMDNETARKWSQLQYAEKVVEFAAEMRRADPDIFIMMEFYTFGVENLEAMLAVAGRSVDAVIHRSTDKKLIAGVNVILRDYNLKNGTGIVFVNTEWLPDVQWPVPFTDNEVPHDFVMGTYGRGDYKKALNFRQISWFYSLNAACVLMDLMSADTDIYLANFNNCVNTWGQNVIEASKEKAWLSMAGEVFRLFADAQNARTTAVLTDKEKGEDTNTDIKIRGCVTKGEETLIFILNKTAEEVQLRLNDMPPRVSAEYTSLSAPDPLSRKEHSSREVIVIDASDDLIIRPYSLNKIKIVDMTDQIKQ